MINISEDRKAFTIFYSLGTKLYVNVTNKCHCNCIFCIRNLTDSVGSAETLWLSKEPCLEEMKSAFVSRQDIGKDILSYDEIVFCGYGEPLERAEDVVSLAHFIKEKSKLPLRLNTNGLIRLINPSFDVNKLAVFESISISLNADDAPEYLRVTRPSFGLGSFDVMLEFIKDAKSLGDVTLSVVEGLDPMRIENCRKLAAKMDVMFRVR